MRKSTLGLSSRSISPSAPMENFRWHHFLAREETSLGTTFLRLSTRIKSFPAAEILANLIVFFILFFQSHKIFVSLAAPYQAVFVSVNHYLGGPCARIVLRRHGVAVGSGALYGQALALIKPGDHSVFSEKIARLADRPDDIKLNPGP